MARSALCILLLLLAHGACGLLVGPAAPLHARAEPPRRARAPVCEDACGENCVGDFMTPIADALELAPDQDMSEAADLMVSKGITGAPVVDNGKLVGVLSQFDFLLKGAGVAALDLTSASYRRDVQKILAGKVRSAMTLNPTTCDPGDTMQSVAAVMVRRRFNHVPVVDSSGKIVGILRCERRRRPVRHRAPPPARRPHRPCALGVQVDGRHEARPHQDTTLGCHTLLLARCTTYCPMP